MRILMPLRQVQSPCAKIAVGSGSEQQSYFIHKPILEAHSAFFRTCLNGNFAESQGEGQINLPGDRRSTFNHVVSWLYNRPLSVDSFSSSFDIIELYVLADKIMCTELKNDAIDLLQVYHQTRTGGVVISLQKLVDGNLIECHAMEYLVQQASCDMAKFYDNMWDNNEWEAFLALGPKLTKKILDETQRIHVKGQGMPDPATLIGCIFHEHDAAERANCEASKSKRK